MIPLIFLKLLTFWRICKVYVNIIIRIRIIHYIYIALFCFSKHSKRSTLSGGIFSSTTTVQHPPGWCDGSHSVPERPPHTSLLVERRLSDAANQWMGMIRRSWWSEANRRIWLGCRGHTSTLFKRDSGIFNEHRKSGAWFNVSSEGHMTTTILCLSGRGTIYYIYFVFYWFD